LAGSTYKPGNPRDPLDAEVAHGLLIECVNPPLRTTPREAEKIRVHVGEEDGHV